MEYTNLTTLEGLQVGDVITYDTTTTIDFKGCKVKVELYGASWSGSYGGLTVFLLDHSKLNGALLSFNKNLSTLADGTYLRPRNDLIYGDSSSLYYRIAVAGSAGAPHGSSYIGGKGGGLEGGRGANSGGRGGTQTAGGTRTDSLGMSGGFGYGGYYKLGTPHYGGYGWYGGGTGDTYGTPKGDGGGSGFVIGQSTTTYPAEYFDGNTELISQVESAVSEATLTQGGSSETSPKMVLTILEVASITGPTQSVIPVFKEGNFINTNIKYYDGESFVDCDAYYYDGTEFKKI